MQLHARTRKSAWLLAEEPPAFETEAVPVAPPPPLSALYDAAAYRAMNADVARTAAYEAALEAALGRAAHASALFILDVGCGALLTLTRQVRRLAARVRPDLRIIALAFDGNGAAARRAAMDAPPDVTVLHLMSGELTRSHLEMAGWVVGMRLLVMMETAGFLAGVEGAAATCNDVVRVAAPHISDFVAAAQFSEALPIHLRVEEIEPKLGLRWAQGSHVLLGGYASASQERLWGGFKAVEELDFRRGAQAMEQTREAVFTANAHARVNAVLFRVVLDCAEGGRVVAGATPRSNWELLVVLLPYELPVEPGESVRLVLRSNYTPVGGAAYVVWFQHAAAVHVVALRRPYLTYAPVYIMR